ncbi:hypothetical protein GJ496_001207 [Pomphorhynchus laevis]|nr:hypothetical protein GJ496_001207 [Pomphorhynchus laevis]
MLNYNDNGNSNANIYENGKLVPSIYNDKLYSERISKSVSGQWIQPLLTDYNNDKYDGFSRTYDDPCSQLWPSRLGQTMDYQYYTKSNLLQQSTISRLPYDSVENQQSSVSKYNPVWQMNSLSSGSEFNLHSKSNSSTKPLNSTGPQFDNVENFNCTKSVLSFSNQISQLLRYKSCQSQSLEEPQHSMIASNSKSNEFSNSLNDHLKSKLNVLDGNYHSSATVRSTPSPSQASKFVDNAKHGNAYSFEKNRACNSSTSVDCGNSDQQPSIIDERRNTVTPNHHQHIEQQFWPQSKLTVLDSSHKSSNESSYIDQQFADNRRPQHCDSHLLTTSSVVNPMNTESNLQFKPRFAQFQSRANVYATSDIPSSSSNARNSRFPVVAVDNYHQTFYTNDDAADLYNGNAASSRSDTIILNDQRQHQQIMHSTVSTRDQYERKKKTVVEQISERVIKRLVRLVCEEVDEGTFKHSVAVSTEDDIDMEFARCCALFAKWAPYFKNNHSI